MLGNGDEEEEDQSGHGRGGIDREEVEEGWYLTSSTTRARGEV